MKKFSIALVLAVLVAFTAPVLAGSFHDLLASPETAKLETTNLTASWQQEQIEITLEKTDATSESCTNMAQTRTPENMELAATIVTDDADITQVTVTGEAGLVAERCTLAVALSGMVNSLDNETETGWNKRHFAAAMVTVTVQSADERTNLVLKMPDDIVLLNVRTLDTDVNTDAALTTSTCSGEKKTNQVAKIIDVIYEVVMNPGTCVAILENGLVLKLPTNQVETKIANAGTNTCTANTG